MDEAVAGYATRIELEVSPGDGSKIRDNGRGIPVDPHPTFHKKSALEVILTTLHAGGKFGGKVYDTSGGLHGVGVSVVKRSRIGWTWRWRATGAWRQRFRSGMPEGQPRELGRSRIAAARPSLSSRPEIFADAGFLPPLLTGWRAPRPICSVASNPLDVRPVAAASRKRAAGGPAAFSRGLVDFLTATCRPRHVHPRSFFGQSDFPAWQRGRRQR